jgi:CAAX protease family protein
MPFYDKGFLDDLDFKVAAGLILGYGALLNTVIPDALNVPANITAAGTAFYLATRRGLTLRDMGLEPDHIPSGLRRGLGAAAPIPVVIALAVAIPLTRRCFLHTKLVDASTPGALYDMLVRVPFGTALSEEILFRAVLLAFSNRNHDRLTGAAMTSAVFGAWHVLPARRSFRTNDAFHATVQGGRAPKLSAAGGTVAITALGGLLLCRLRRQSGSVVAPWIFHSALNSLTNLGGRIAAHLDRHSPGHVT